MKTLEISQLIKQSKRCIVFTGAGMSTESGIPDFRSSSGIWNKLNPLSDLCIVLGSSCSVFPASRIPIIVKNRNGKVVIINKDSTDLDTIADIIINNTLISDTLKEINHHLIY